MSESTVVYGQGLANSVNKSQFLKKHNKPKSGYFLWEYLLSLLGCDKDILTNKSILEISKLI